MQIFSYEKTPEQRKKIKEIILQDKELRLAYFPHDFFAFMMYYFWEKMFTGVKDFHKQIAKICVGDCNAGIIWFRECGKTAIVALFYIIYCIATRREKFIIFLAYDLDSATDKVSNIITVLKTNQKLKEDYWLLFDDWQSKKDNLEKWVQQKTMSKFVSTTGVKVQGVSLKNMKRGKQFVDEDGNILRPSLLIGDDIDIEESVKNERIIEENWQKINRAVLKSLRWRAIFLGNAIGEDGIMPRIKEILCAINPNVWSFLEIPLLDQDNNIVWQERYVWKLEEAKKINEEKYGGQKIVVSIEELRVDEASFLSDYMNIPSISVGNPIFNGDKIQESETVTPVFSFQIPIEEKIFTLDVFYKDFRRDFYDYLFCWVDTAGWEGGDSDHTDMTFLDKNGKLYARVTSNELNYKKAKMLLDILHLQYGFTFFDFGLCIERNYLWVALIEELKTSPLLSKCYVDTSEGKRKERRSANIGWNTTNTSKEIMKEDLNTAINIWKLQFDSYTKKEFIAWSMERQGERIVYTNNKRIAPHDDSVISYWLALQAFLFHNPKFLWTERNISESK